jgi:hypothetical protein
LHRHEPRRLPPDRGAVARGRITGSYVMLVRRYEARELIADGRRVACRDRGVEFLRARIAMLNAAIAVSSSCAHGSPC